MRKITILLAILLANQALATEIVSVSALTDRILLLEFDDGYVELPGYGGSRDASKVIAEPLDTEAAVNKAFYTIESRTDSHYSIKQHPIRVGRKSKPTEVTRNWPPVQDVVYTHWIYLELPEPMKRGVEYTISTQVKVKGKSKHTFLFDEYGNRSEAIRVNQVGYKKGSDKKPGYQPKKYAYVSHWMGDLGPLSLDAYENSLYYVVELKNMQPVYVGKLKKRKDFETGTPETKHLDETPRGQYHASDVFECDFSACQSTGEMILVIEGIGHSFPFTIEKDVYREAFITTCRGLFHERAGIDKIQPWSRWNHLADHNGAKGYPLYYTKYRFMDSNSEGGSKTLAEKMETGIIPTWGWYHDAGDWDGYPTHMVIPSYLLTTYEMAPGNFIDGELNIPESGNGIPDILDEASWLLKYFKRTRHIARDLGYATGGIPGSRVHGDYWKKPELKPSWEDDRKWFVFGEESLASFRYAGQAAQLAHCLQIAGFGDSAAVWRSEATEVYQWALNNSLEDDDIKSARFFASVWLYRLTGKTEYHQQAMNDNPVTGPKMNMPSENRNWATWGIWSYATMDASKADPELFSQTREVATWWADTLNVIPSENRAFRFGNSWGHPMVVGQATTPKVFPCMIAFEITGETKYLETMIHTSDYMLGGNPLNYCWVTGLGDRSPIEILHIDSWVDLVEEPVEGQVPYGPIFEGNRGGPGFNGPWDGDFLRDIVYPDTALWPGHELWTENRWCPITNEYTVHQNISLAAAVYGYLCGKAQ